MLQRNSTNYLNEPYVTGGNPVLANGKVLFNDMLGTTQGSISKNGKYQPTNTTAFGAGDKTAFFTGKPYVEGLGSVFLFRNYRPELSKWTSSDPLGYPDGWNNFSYGNNAVTSGFDYQGTEWVETGYNVDGRDNYTDPNPTTKETGTCSYGGKQCFIYANTAITYSFNLTESYSQGSAESGNLVCIWVYDVIQTTTVYNTYEEVTSGQIVYTENPPRVTTSTIATVTHQINYVWE